MSNIHAQKVRQMMNDIKQHISIPNHIEYEAALEAEDKRLLSLLNEAFSEELLSNDVLNFHHLHRAASLEELTNLIDNFTAIIIFYKDNHPLFTHLINEPFFKDNIKEKGDLNVWNEVMSHSYKHLNYQQTKTLVLDSLSRLHINEESHSHPLIHMR